MVMAKSPAQPARRILTEGDSGKRMGLASVTRGKQKKPKRILIMGPEGIGKTTFAADAPGVVLIDAEDGSSSLDVARFPVPQTLQDVYDAIDELMRVDHAYTTLAIDTVDRIESLVHRHVCDNATPQKTSIEDFGYGKGFQFALEEWRRLFARLDELRTRKNMTIILLGHVVIRTFKNPSGDDFDRYQLRVNDKAGGFMKEWCDFVGFAQFETVTRKQKGNPETARSKATLTGARIMHTVRDAAWDAKNRDGLPEELSFSWQAFDEAMNAAPAPDEVRAKIEVVLKELPDDEAARARAQVAVCGDDVTRLAKALDYFNGRVRAAQQTQEA